MARAVETLARGTRDKMAVAGAYHRVGVANRRRGIAAAAGAEKAIVADDARSRGLRARDSRTQK